MAILDRGENKVGGFIIGAIVVLALWAFISMRSKAKSHEAFNALDEAENWFAKEGINSSSVTFSAYNDPRLSKHAGATVLVCMGKKRNGERVGFALEIIKGVGVVDSAHIQPEGIASHHVKAAHIAKMNGKTLIATLQEMALKHRLNHVR